MDKKIAFEVENFSVVDEYSDSQLAIVEIYVCHDGNNAHNMPIDLEVLKKAKKTLKNKFLVAGFDGDDFEGHEPDEQIVGFFPESSKMSFVEKNGKTFLVAQAIMSKIYADWAYEVFVEENERAVSMEISVLGTEIGDDGLEHITKFVFNGVTLLGKSHMPACEGANASIIKFSQENALKVYSKHFKSSDEIKKNFMENMKLADNSGKEDSTMEKEIEVVETVEETTPVEEVEEVVTEETPAEEVTETVEEEVAEPVEEETATEEFEETSEDESNEEDDTYMDEESHEDDEDEKDETEEEEAKAEEKDFETLTVEQKYEVFRSAVREALECGYLESYDDEYLYVYDYCESYTYRYTYTLEGTTCTIALDSKTRVMRGGYVEFEVYEEQENKMEAIETENCELKEKLAAYETAEKDKAVESILADVVDVLSAERVAELREKSVNYSLDNLSDFSNEVKAIAFEAVKTKTCKYSFERMPIDQPKKTNKYSW